MLLWALAIIAIAFALFDNDIADWQDYALTNTEYKRLEKHLG
jgi:hypothetical protein